MQWAEGRCYSAMAVRNVFSEAGLGGVETHDIVADRSPLDGKETVNLGRAMATSKPTRWSQDVTENSSALDLEPGVFTFEDPRKIAQSLKTSAEASKRRKTTAFRSAMSMLTFYINRAGSQLSAKQRQRLESAKDELRALYARPRKQRR